MRYKVVQITSDIDRLGRKNIKNVLRGTLHGSVLFHDINSIGKYIGELSPLLNGVPLFKYANISSVPSFVVERKPHL